MKVLLDYKHFRDGEDFFLSTPRSLYAAIM